MKPRKIDFAKDCKDLYAASRDVRELKVGRAAYLAVDGRGRPGGEAFQTAVPALYGMAYTIKFALKFGGRVDFAVGKLECQYLDPDPKAVPMDEWAWRLLLRVPEEEVKAGELAAARRSLREKRGVDASSVRRRTFTEGRVLQTLHAGPYEELGRAYDGLLAFARERGLEAAGPGHEIYLNDPRRAAPARLKTIVRLPVKRASAALSRG